MRPQLWHDVTFNSVGVTTTCMRFSPRSRAYSPDATSEPGASSTIDRDRVDPQRIVAAHNSWRNNVGVIGLKWSPDLANQAIAWANELKENNGCRMKHSGPGENLHWASALKTATKEGDGDWQWQSRVQEVSAQQVVDSWGNEIQYLPQQQSQGQNPKWVWYTQLNNPRKEYENTK